MAQKPGAPRANCDPGGKAKSKRTHGSESLRRGPAKIGDASMNALSGRFETVGSG